MFVNVPTYAILDVSDPLVAWLVYRGEMVSAPQAHEQALSFWLTSYLQTGSTPAHPGAKLDAEFALERLRSEHFPDAVSRLRGFFLFADETSARAAIRRWGGPFRGENVAEVALRPGAVTSRHDAEWISDNLVTDPSREWMYQYFRGDTSSGDPIWELLVDGRAVVYGTSLRKRAYDVVSATWPDSMALLELSRLSVELSSDLGLITPMYYATANSRRIDYAMNVIDLDNPEFAGRLGQYEGPRNNADLHADAALVLPDLRTRGIDLV